MDREADATRLELTPETGRSHQLRVHLKEIGHPILGDPFYAPEDIYRAVKFIIECDYFNGRTIDVDGGALLP